MKKIDPITRRLWDSLGYRNPFIDLVELGKLQAQCDKAGTTARLDYLRSRQLRKYLEYRQAALLCYIVAKTRLKQPAYYAMIEEEDYDCVFRWKTFEGVRFAPVQLKELVPEYLNRQTDLHKELNKLSKYSKSNSVAALNVNRFGSLADLIKIPKLQAKVKEIWLYGSLAADQSRWFLYGDLLSKRNFYEVGYPTTER